MSAPLDAVRLVGLLAEPARRRVVAALVLGASDVDGLVTATGLTRREVVDAVWRLQDAELVIGDDESLWLVEEAFAHAARTAAPAPPPDDGNDAVLRPFVRDGRITAIPTARSKRRVLLDLLAQEFTPGERYPERRVNEILGRWHDDTAALRRYLVDEEFLDRANGEYWRAGGTVEV
ncbi:MAG: DUF2087 domain-containing protein [Actinomycetota bacterium]